jgi:hypothetical protein
VHAQANKELEQLRRSYEKTRAMYYTNPTEEQLKAKLVAREQVRLSGGSGDAWCSTLSPLDPKP